MVLLLGANLGYNQTCSKYYGHVRYEECYWLWALQSYGEKLITGVASGTVV